MTKELELLVKKWRDDGIRLNGGADKPYSDDENSVRAFVLEHCAEELAAALAKAQEGEKVAPVQGYAAGIPWSLHLEAYDAYCKRYSKQQALIEDGCRGGFGTEELDMFIPGWRDRASEIGKLRARVVELETLIDQQKAPDGEAEAHLGRVGEPVGYVHPDTIKGLQAGLCTKSYLFAKPMPQVWADVPLYTSPQLPSGVPSQEQLIDWAIGWRASDTREGLSGEADIIERITYAIRSRMLAAIPQPDSKEPR